MADELGGDELRRRRMMSKDVEHFKSVVDTARRDLVPQDDLLAVVMRARVEEEGARRSPCGFATQRVHRPAICCPPARLKDGPAGETARDFLHVLLSVTTVDAESVQLHQLASVVFVYAASRLLLLLLL